MNIKKVSIFSIFILCLFMSILSVSATNYYVNNDTQQKDIEGWMKNKASTGDNLIFNTSTYELSDTLVVNKKINILSYKNTEINFRKSN